MQHFVAFWGDFLTIFLTPKWRFWRPPSDPQCPSKYLHSELIWNALGFLRRTWRILAVFWDRGGFSNSGVNILLLYMIYNIKPTLQFYIIIVLLLAPFPWYLAVCAQPNFATIRQPKTFWCIVQRKWKRCMQKMIHVPLKQLNSIQTWSM